VIRASGNFVVAGTATASNLHAPARRARNTRNDPRPPRGCAREGAANPSRARRATRLGYGVIVALNSASLKTPPTGALAAAKTGCAVPPANEVEM